MTLQEKIQKVRCGLKEQKITMTGKNTYAGYDYFELNDFLPALNKLMLENKMTALPSFNDEIASLTAYDFESEQKITITSPMGSANLKGCHEVQNIGAVETYQRRYLYQTMFDIAESDALNGTQGKEEQKPKAVNKKSTISPVRTNIEILKSLILSNPIEASIIKDIIDTQFGGKPSRELTEEECGKILNQLADNTKAEDNGGKTHE